MKKFLSMLLILIASVALQSQKVKKDSTQTVIPVVAVDSSAFYKSRLDSINTDINRTVTRIERKIEQIPNLVEKVVISKALRLSRPDVSVAVIPPAVIPSGLSEPRIDSLVIEKPKKKRFRIFRKQ